MDISRPAIKCKEDGQGSLLVECRPGQIHRTAAVVVAIDREIGQTGGIVPVAGVAQGQCRAADDAVFGEQREIEFGESAPLRIASVSVATGLELGQVLVLANDKVGLVEATVTAVNALVMTGAEQGGAKIVLSENRAGPGLAEIDSALAVSPAVARADGAAVLDA